MIVQLPFTNDPAQQVTVQLGTVKYDFTVRWNDRARTWCLDMLDHNSQSPIVQGVPLVLGLDLLQPLALVGVGSLVVNDEDNSGLDAGPDDLGGRVNVYWFSDGASS
jgi:hypothetical protein